MRVLVTGGAGYIGSHTLVQLLRKGDEVLVYDNFSNSSIESLRRVQRLTNKTFPIHTGDIQDRNTLRNAFESFQPEAVVHFAGLKAVGESTQIPLHYYGQNVSGTIELLSAMQDYNCEILVFSSSATVYGESVYLPYDENHPLQPINVYGRTKYFVEEIIQDWAQAWPKARAVLLRYFNPAGADVSGQIGENPLGVSNNLMPYISQVAAGKRQYLDIYGGDYQTEDGTGKRDYIHVTDLATAHLRALGYAQSEQGCEIFNVGTGHATSVLEMVHAFEKASDKPIPYHITPRRTGDVAQSVASVAKARRLLGWQAKYDIVDMCETAWRWQSENPNGYGVAK